MEKTIVFNLRMSELDRRRLEAIAEYESLSMSALLRQFIRDHYKLLANSGAKLKEIYPDV